MNTKIFIYPYKAGSAGVKELCKSLNAKQIKLKSSRYVPRKHHITINWGSHEILGSILNDPFFKILNHPRAVDIARNKLTTFEVLQDHDVPIPDFTRDKEKAVGWLLGPKEGKGTGVLVRKLLGASRGQGIEKVNFGDFDLPNAPLYVRYIKKHKEYRVHVFGGQVIDIQEKRISKYVPKDQIDHQIRSHERGWVFCREGVTLSDTAQSIAVQAVQAVGLDFGAVDMIYNKKEDKYYVLEINTAPGLEGETIINYSNAIKTYAGAMK
jgi:glutathione synthase/RimK-type ligase-like ATP-grasp enzyme